MELRAHRPVRPDDDDVASFGIERRRRGVASGRAPRRVRLATHRARSRCRFWDRRCRARAPSPRQEDPRVRAEREMRRGDRARHAPSLPVAKATASRRAARRGSAARATAARASAALRPGSTRRARRAGRAGSQTTGTGSARWRRRSPSDQIGRDERREPDKNRRRYASCPPSNAPTFVRVSPEPTCVSMKRWWSIGKPSIRFVEGDRNDDDHARERGRPTARRSVRLVRLVRRPARRAICTYPTASESDQEQPRDLRCRSDAGEQARAEEAAASRPSHCRPSSVRREGPGKAYDREADRAEPERREEKVRREREETDRRSPGRTARTRAALAAGRFSAPAARAIAKRSHGTSVATTAVTTCTRPASAFRPRRSHAQRFRRARDDRGTPAADASPRRRKAPRCHQSRRARPPTIGGRRGRRSRQSVGAWFGQARGEPRLEHPRDAARRRERGDAVAIEREGEKSLELRGTTRCSPCVHRGRVRAARRYDSRSHSAGEAPGTRRAGYRDGRSRLRYRRRPSRRHHQA